ncbi:iron chaperone [Streptococcus jiangjianxini]|uniref:iron chaperone n=1 Tax=Streptococcus jiangjianxini TaxID=3161189 RepID=UPI0032EC5D78
MKRHVFEDYLKGIDNDTHQDKVSELLYWILDEFSELEPVIKWNQPMVTHDGTYIFGLSVSKQHIAISPEVATIKQFKDDIEKNGYSHTDNIVRIKWKEAIDYDLIRKMIVFQMEEKAGFTNFWR